MRSHDDRGFVRRGHGDSLLIAHAPSVARKPTYSRRRPEKSVLHQVVRDNLRTLYAAIEQGFAAPLPRFVREELEVTSIAACFREASQCWRAQNAPCASSSGSPAGRWRLGACHTQTPLQRWHLRPRSRSAVSERYLRWLGESVDPPTLAPARDPPFFQEPGDSLAVATA